MLGKLKNIFKVKTKKQQSEENLPKNIKDFINNVNCDDNIKQRIIELIKSMDNTALKEFEYMIEHNIKEMKDVRRHFKKKIIPKVLLGEYNEDSMFYIYLVFKYIDKCDKVKENRVRNEYEGLVTKISPKSASKILKKQGYNIRI